MRKATKLVSLMLAIALSTGILLTGCGNSNSSNSTAVNSSVSSSTEAVKTDVETTPELDEMVLNMYLLGSAPKDGPAVMEAVNAKLQKDINATIALQYIAFGDIATKFPLVLASGEDWDIILGAHNYTNNAVKGGYHEITLEDVQKYAPLTDKATTKEQWADTLVNGKIYLIPQTFKELDLGGLFYREDLRKKFGVPEIKTAADLIVYMRTLKQNGITPIDGTGGDDISAIFLSMLSDETSFNRSKIAAIDNLVCYDITDPTYSTKGLMDAEYVAQFKKVALETRKLYEEGLLPKNGFANKTRAFDLFKTEKSAVWINAFENYPQYVTDTKAKGWEVGFYNSSVNKGSILLRPSTGNGLALSPALSGAKYQRALMAVDMVTQEPSYNMLVSFGIENKNYVMKDAKLDLAPGIDPADNPYPMYGAGFWSSNRDQWPPLINQTQDYIELKKNLQAKSVSYLLNGFNVNEDSIKTELANLTNVYSQYATSIKLGLAKDTDKAVDTLIEKMKAAGAEKVVTEYKKQIAEYVAAHAIK